MPSTVQVGHAYCLRGPQPPERLLPSPPYYRRERGGTRSRSRLESQGPLRGAWLLRSWLPTTSKRGGLGCLAMQLARQEDSSVSCLRWVGGGREASGGGERGAAEPGRATGTASSAGNNVGPNYGALHPSEATRPPPWLPGPALVWPQPRHSSHCLPSRGVGHPGPRPALRPVRRFTPDS